MKKYIWFLLLVIIIVGLFFYYKNQNSLIKKNENVNNNKNITKETVVDFDSCVNAGGQKDHMEGSSFCRINEQNYYYKIPEGAIN